MCEAHALFWTCLQAKGGIYTIYTNHLYIVNACAKYASSIYEMNYDCGNCRLQMSKNCTMDELQASVKAKAEEVISTRAKTVPKKRKMDQSNQTSSLNTNSSRQRNNRPTLSHSSNSTGRPRYEQSCGFYNYRGCFFSSCWDAHVFDSAAGSRMAGIRSIKEKD